ncbi:ABC transporter permease [Chungangia koreensis]|uniref:ABC transporter permease n=1 Tax=Chungangia koreensis TaxID=752657 RepID=A0ABV8X745_9LACT
MKLFINQCKIEFLRIFRNPYFLFWSLAMPIVFYIFFTKVLNTGVEDKAVWDAHFLMSITVFSVMGSAIMTLGIRLVQEQREGWTKYIRVTPLPDMTYFFAKMTGQTAVHIFSIIIIFTVGFLINDISLTASEWTLSGLWILVGSLPFLALGVLIGFMKRVDTASGVSNAIYMILAITGGLWMPMEILPEFIQTVGKALPAYHYGNGAWSIIRGDIPNVQDILILSSYLILFMVVSNYIRRKQEAV